MLAAATARAQFRVRTVNGAPNSVTDIDIAETDLASDPTAGTGLPAVINYLGSSSPGDFGGDSAFPSGTNSDDFAMEALAQLTFNTAGTYIFRVNSDDGFRLRLNVNGDGSGGTVYTEFTGQRGPGNTDGSGMVFGVGDTLNLRLTYFDRGGGSEVEFSYSNDNGATFQLVGSTADISVAPIPEPTTALLVCFAIAGIALARRFCQPIAVRST